MAAAASEDFMPEPVLGQFLTILAKHFTAKEPTTGKIKKQITEYTRKELTILDNDWKGLVGDPVQTPPHFSSSSESSECDINSDNEEVDEKPEISEIDKQPMMNQEQFITQFFASVKDTLSRMSNGGRRYAVRSLCDVLNVGPKFRKRFQIKRVSA